MIDPISKDDPKFKELVKVRRGVLVGTLLLGQSFWDSGSCGQKERVPRAAERGLNVVLGGGTWRVRRLKGAMDGVKVRAWSTTQVPGSTGPLKLLAYALPSAEGAAGVN